MRGKSLCRVLLLSLWLMTGVGTLVATAGCTPQASPALLPTSTLELTTTYTPVPINTLTPTVTHTSVPFGQIIADDVPGRSGPGREYAMFGTLSRGDLVEILAVEGEWCKARSEKFDDDVWIYARYVQDVAAVPLVTPTQPSASAPEPSRCGPPAGWVIYIVQQGDTLYSLARQTGTTVDALLNANCLSSTTIHVGQQLYVPRQSPLPTDTPALPPIDTPTLPPIDTPTLPFTPLPTDTPRPPTDTPMLPPTDTPALPPTDTPTLPPAPTPTLPSALTPTPTDTASPPPPTPTPTASGG